MLKKTLILLTMITINSYISSYPEKPLNERNLPTYVEHYVQTLFDAHRDQPREIKEFIREIQRGVTAIATGTCEEIFIIFPTGNYTQDCVEHAIKIKAREHVIAYATEIAYQYTHDLATINRVTDAIRDEINTIFNSSSNLNGSLRKYKGEELRAHILRLKDKIDHEKRELAKRAEEQQRAPQFTHYPSVECGVCFESFADVQRVYFSPCGHNICVGCAQGILMRPNPVCHLCRASIHHTING